MTFILDESVRLNLLGGVRDLDFLLVLMHAFQSYLSEWSLLIIFGRCPSHMANAGYSIFERQPRLLGDLG